MTTRRLTSLAHAAALINHLEAAVDDTDDLLLYLDLVALRDLNRRMTGHTYEAEPTSLDLGGLGTAAPGMKLDDL